LVSLATLLAAFFTSSAAVALPPGFVDQQVGVNWAGDRQVVGVVFADDGTPFVWEQAGRVWKLGANGQPLAQPLLDIREEVGNWRDYGLLGLALHPDFEKNGFFYLLYVVDRHHLLYFGTPSYNPNANEYFNATIGRLTRYQANVADGYQTLVPNSRTVLIGSAANNGFPIVHQSHGIGQLIFAHDGSLIASCGDAASYETVDTGGGEGSSYGAQAVADGILRPAEDCGAFRAQLVNCHNGKILRMDAMTGAGLSDNPFFDPQNPFSPQSRVWALGFRNPFRIGMGEAGAPGTPGKIIVGDVQWSTWEEVTVLDAPGLNGGWPIYEGLTTMNSYASLNEPNLDEPNPLFGGACTLQYFRFRDLIRQDTLDPDPVFPNPCQPAVDISDTVPCFVHKRPMIDWGHGSNGPTRAPIFDINGNATTATLGFPDCPVQGTNFGGVCSVGGAWYTGNTFPAEYRDSWFQADYGFGWIKNFRFGPAGNLEEIRIFGDFMGLVVDIEQNPVDGSLWYVRFPSQIRRITYPDGCLAADFDLDHIVGFSDLLILLSTWGPCGGCPADIDDDEVVDFDDLLGLLTRWGPC